MKRLLYFLPILIAVSGCGSPDHAKALDPQKVRYTVNTASAIEVNSPVIVPVLGAITSASRSNIGAEMDGRVIDLLVREGQQVKAGQALIKLAGDDASTRVDAARGGLEQAILSAEADEKISAARLAQSTLDYRSAQDRLNSNVSLAQARLDESQARFDQLKRGPRQQEIEAANSDVVAAQSVVESDQSTVDYTKLILKRKSSLLAQGGISQNDVDAAQLDYNHALQSVQFAQQQLRAKELYLNLLKEGTPKEELAQGAAQLAGAKEALRAAKAALATLDDSKQAVLIAQADHNRAFSRLTQLKTGKLSDEGAKVALAQEDLARTQIRTPIDGVVASIKVVKGQVARSGQIVAEVVGRGGIQMEATAMDQDVAKIQSGQSVAITLRDNLQVVYLGTVREVLPPGSEGHSSRIIVSISDGQGLTPGQVVNGEVRTSATQPVLQIPESAVFGELEGEADVYVIDGDFVKRRPVQLGEKRNGLVNVVAGLASGDQVVLHPPAEMRDGSPVTVRVGPGAHK